MFLPTSSTAVFSSLHLVRQAQVFHYYYIFIASQLIALDIYCASRSLYGLAKDHQAPRLFAKARENGNPIFAVGFTCLFILLGYLNASKSSSTVFSYFVSLVTVFAVLNWVAILITHIRFRQALKAQGIAVADLPYVGFLQPYGSYFSLFISLLVIVFNGKLF
jgi:amino acid transporter